MKNYRLIAAAIVVFAFSSCVEETVSDTSKPVESTRSNAGMSKAELEIEPGKTIEDKKRFLNGIQIQWFKKGNGESLESGSVYEINYKVKLENGTVVDGNHLLKKEWIPYLYGYNLQTPGWDIAMSELHVGDFVEIYLPAKMARGDKGIPGVIPPNSPNIIFLKVGKKIDPIKNQGGVKVWLFERNKDLAEYKIKDNSEVAIDYFVGTKSNPRYDNSYQRNSPFTFRMTDISLVPGLKIGLKDVQLFDKVLVLVPAKQAYGSKGYVDLVKPNEDLVYELFIADVDRNSVKVLKQAEEAKH